MSQSDVNISSREDFYRHFLSRLEARFPLEESFKGIRFEKRMVSNQMLELSRETYEKIQNFALALFELRLNRAFQDRILQDAPPLLRFDPGNYSVLMGYDFHLTEKGDPKLLEINTNAAFSVPLDLIYQCHYNSSSYDSSSEDLSHFRRWDVLNELKRSFLEEIDLSNIKMRETIAIVDQTPWSQPFAREFLIFQKLFEEWGFKTVIASPEELVFRDDRLWYQDSLRIDIVYNRMTDFLLQDPHSQSIAAAYLNGSICLSPNPHEYYLLAMKDRLTQFCNREFLSETGLTAQSIETLTSIVPRTIEVHSDCDRDELWRSRRQLFFKPKQSFGSKGTYRGMGVTTKVFEEILTSGDYIAQEYHPAQTVTISGIEQPLKYDLRFYVYKDQIQLAGARLYHGQVTNFQSEVGGFAAIKII